MATVPMRYIVEMSWDEWVIHSLRREWLSNQVSFIEFFKQYNINVVGTSFTIGVYRIELESEQDYILWQLYQ